MKREEAAMTYVGQSTLRVDAVAKVTGEAQFASDFNLPNQAYMKILFAGRPHAIIKRLDVARAEAYPGSPGGADGQRRASK